MIRCNIRNDFADLNKKKFEIKIGLFPAKTVRSLQYVKPPHILQRDLLAPFYAFLCRRNVPKK